MTRPDTARALRGLKDFQLDTVNYVFHRMYEQPEPARRFLVADEVGLGKTKVAQGVVAKVIDRLWDTVPRIDIVYICSNAAIARQNINRLNLPGLPRHSLPDRITLLPGEVRNLGKNRVNLISFTPGTSFNLRSSQGIAPERALLYWLLPDEWKVHDEGAISLLRGTVARERFRARVKDYPRANVDQSLQQEYRRRLESTAADDEGRSSLHQRFVELSKALGKRVDLTTDEDRERASIVVDLRSRLAASCIQSLEPDLIILDEFQRFRDLLHGDDGASDLARQLFTFKDARVLMLSATPYKMFTLPDEAGGDEHYADFVQTVRFLQHDETATGSFRQALTDYRKELFRVGLDGAAGLVKARESVQRQLRNVMVRTERLAVTADRSGMLTEVPTQAMTLSAHDVDGFLGIQKVARALGQPDALEYWKSAPYLLSFMDSYKLKEQFLALAGKEGAAQPLADAVAAHTGLVISAADVEAYRKIDPANARLRALMADTLDRGTWRMLWLAPSLPYYELEGEFAGDAAKATKRLVFSAWHVVPKVVASMLSYEAERRLLQVPDDGQPDLNTQDARQRRRGLMRFSIAEGRPTGMPALALLYPCLTLALDYDPLRLDSRGQSLAGLHQQYVARLTTELERLGADMSTGTAEPDQRWYWAAPLLLDRANHPQATGAWFAQANLAGLWRGDDASATTPTADDHEADGGGTPAAWTSHVEAARQMVRPAGDLGPAPADLADVLAWMALASPGVTALRALGRVCGSVDRCSDNRLRNQAGRIAEGLRSLFNQPDVVPLVRGAADSEPYWRRVLEYGGRGCLQAVMDEYAHALVEWTGAAGKTWPEIANEVAAGMVAALSLRTATVAADRITAEVPARAVKVGEKLRLRTNYAVRFGASGEDKAESVNRDGDLQKAFNSPFWPFVMCSTSVGQEGLDFHLYCHAVVHWNLPSNPVDLEQREGRVHRFKGHAVRRNVAQRFADAAFDPDRQTADPWSAMFEAAQRARAADESDLVPFWVCTADDGARIERHVPTLPLSKDWERANALRRSLAVYRMAFGQSRQDDLVKFLVTCVPEDQIPKMSEELRINLAPDRVSARSAAGATLEPLDDDGTAEPVDGGKALSLSALEDLLDRFNEIRPRPTNAGVERLADLLDQFRTLQLPPAGEPRRE